MVLRGVILTSSWIPSFLKGWTRPAPPKNRRKWRHYIFAGPDSGWSNPSDSGAWYHRLLTVHCWWKKIVFFPNQMIYRVWDCIPGNHLDLVLRWKLDNEDIPRFCNLWNNLACKKEVDLAMKTYHYSYNMSLWTWWTCNCTAVWPVKKKSGSFREEMYTAPETLWLYRWLASLNVGFLMLHPRKKSPERCRLWKVVTGHCIDTILTRRGHRGSFRWLNF